MALPQQVVERLSRETPKTPGWSSELLAFAVAIFMIAVVIYVGIVYGYRPYASGQVQKLDNQISLFEQQVPQSDQEHIAAFYSQLINLRNVLGSREAVSPFFPWLEAHTETNVYFSELKALPTRHQLGITGNAKTAADAALQARIFEQDPNISNVLVNSVTQNVAQSGDASAPWQFTMTITFAPTFFASLPADAGSQPVTVPPPVSAGAAAASSTASSTSQP